jgi:hypothetical protein
LTGEKIHRAHHHHSKVIGVLIDKIENVFRANGELAFARARQNKRVFRIQSVVNELRLNRVGIGRERRLFHQDFEARFGWLIKRRHHQVEVHREAIHADHFE